MPKICTMVLRIDRKWGNGDLERLNTWLNQPSWLHILHDSEHSIASSSRMLLSKVPCVSSTVACTEHTGAWQKHGWRVTLTLAGFQDHPVGGGVTLHLPACTQAGHLDRVCLKVGHTQKHCRETGTRPGQLQKRHNHPQVSTSIKFEFKVPQPVVGNPPSTVNQYTKESYFMTLKSSCRMWYVIGFACFLWTKKKTYIWKKLQWVVKLWVILNLPSSFIYAFKILLN